MRTIEIIDNEIKELKERMMTVKGTDTEVYTRIVGYYRSVKNWNKGKRDEYNQRKLFTQPGKPSIREAAETIISTASFNEAPEPQRAVLSGATAEPAGYYYFFRTTCPNCPPVKNWLEGFQIEGTAVNVDEKEGFAKAAEYQIFSSPTVIFHDEEGKEMYRASDVRELNTLFEKVTI
ncbi:MAG: anaerobic ribonucleoside-triphosphate reductase [Spirochaetales bacterium]|uniref:Anaerobic ribonucleoside-triphosphate reductase n=1 Tax=Candidatus Thalassospirochaeta sargassi TaxID=3119039 RepID=A0AAJ1MJC9_9SPIO|nr:anaerobic ribonucleoside-triphosphate reductase [Spirochaetales bacterium]